jgi:site-specific DNA-methyltransferase (adenine-specific)
MNKFNAEIKHVAIDTVIPYANNTKKHPVEQINKLASMIAEYGHDVPIVVDADNVVIKGHGRLLACQKLNMATVPVIVRDDLTPTQAKAARIADNKIAESEWDEDLLRLELAELDDLGFDLDLTGFDDFDLGEFDDDVTSLDDDADLDSIPEPPEIPISKRGDVWLCGKHRVMCGDSTSLEDAARLMDEVLADLLITDPPYNVAYTGGTPNALTIQNDDMSDGDFRQFLRDVYTTADSVMKTGASFYIWHADSEGYNFRGAAHDVEWKIRQCLIWVKNTLVLGRQDYHWKHEPCLYGWKDGAAHYWGNDRTQTTVLEFNKPARNGVHPTMKPVELFQYQIENSSKKGDTVLDLFGGSGTTMIACEKTNRVARLMELDEKYCDVIVRRWQEITGKEAVLEGNGKSFNELSNG